MEFVIAGVTISPLLLAGIGFLVGILGGFFGVGGGFIGGPLMYWAGVPMNFVVGTDLAHMTGKSIIATRRHRAMGHVDIKVGLLMVISSIVGVEIGARMIEMLKEVGSVDVVVGVTYIAIQVAVSLFTAWESIRALRIKSAGGTAAKDAVGFQSFTKRIHSIKLPPVISLPVSGIESISLWVVLGVGLFTGILSGLLGIGGGFVRMPLLIYVMGIPTHVAVGTDLFEIIISAGFGTITHALKGNVDISMALMMQIGAAFGAQMGAVATRFFSGPRIRLAFSALPLIGAIMVITRLLSG
ncbi:MAG: sulfite exporter TauE/SafE family protein [Chloroflexi bacterium]|nr:MAG: sulfite exporter TauE/SafE family protein [Chloroflexota bacterium]RLC83912.1 MAG: sulfite exporter TauE/SafE family protein [Chloroflexota bacterium]